MKCGLILQRVVRCDMTTIFLNYQWNLFVTGYELVNVETNKSKVDVLFENKLLRKDVSFIRIDNKYYSSYLKVSKQYSIGHLPPVINTCHISRIFLESITIDISDYIS